MAMDVALSIVSIPAWVDLYSLKFEVAPSHIFFGRPPEAFNETVLFQLSLEDQLPFGRFVEAVHVLLIVNFSLDGNIAMLVLAFGVDLGLALVIEYVECIELEMKYDYIFIFVLIAVVPLPDRWIFCH